MIFCAVLLFATSVYGNMIFCAVLLFATSVYGQSFSEKCVHNNVEMLTSDSVIRTVMADMDKNKDHYIEDLELLIEFVGKFDENQDSHITRSEFVNMWHKLYRDVPEFADYLFDHFDMNHDNTLGLNDVPGIKKRADVDEDGKISEVEFVLFMTHLYQHCVPHQNLAAVPF